MYHGYYGEFLGFSFLGQSNYMLRCGNSNNLTHRVVLEKDERVVGIKSRLVDVDFAKHNDF